MQPISCPTARNYTETGRRGSVIQEQLKVGNGKRVAWQRVHVEGKFTINQVLDASNIQTCSL